MLIRAFQNSYFGISFLFLFFWEHTSLPLTEKCRNAMSCNFLNPESKRCIKVTILLTLLISENVWLIKIEILFALKNKFALEMYTVTLFLGSCSLKRVIHPYLHMYNFIVGLFGQLCFSVCLIVSTSYDLDIKKDGLIHGFMECNHSVFLLIIETSAWLFGCHALLGVETVEIL